MKILAIMGSPIRKRNNEILLETVLDGIRNEHPTPEKIDIQLFCASSLKVSPCIACNRCAQVKGCIFEDDMQTLYQEFENSDVILITSPLYFNSVSAQLKAVIDRCQAIWSSKYALKDSMINSDKRRFGFFISTAGVDLKDNPDLFQGTLPIMDLFFKSIHTEYVGNLFVGNVDQIPVSENKQALEDGFHWGQQLYNSVCS